MTSKLVALGGAALALLMLSAVGPAEAHGSHGVHSMGGPANMGAPVQHHHFHHRVFVGVPFAYGYYYDDGYYHDDGCYWLKRRALNTGSRYWWNRYHVCVNGY
jgi:hypothetical protein